ncbi:Cleft lip and palate transmembrane protein 1-like protein [Schistosoma japonicum]|nr:Cleft lip and palate transmembrane protein 1-like protein [Schistosoma japonicum]
MFRITHVLLVLSLGYICFVSWTLYEVFFPLNCKGSSGCIKPAWKSDDKLTVHLQFLKGGSFAEGIPISETLQINRGLTAKYNCTLLLPLTSNSDVTARLQLLTNFGSVISSDDLSLVTYKEATRTTFNLLTVNESGEPQRSHDLLAPFWLSALRVYVLHTPISFSQNNMPAEIARHIRFSSKGYLPIIYVNPVFQASNDWIEIKRLPKNNQFEILLSVEPISLGHLRLRCTLETIADQLRSYGLRPNDIDEIRGIFLDTNLYLLLTTLFVSVFHLLFNFLAFKNDISFWRVSDNTVGISLRTIVWRFLSSFIIFLHLWEQKSSLLVSVPMGISTLIELWKLRRMTKFSISFRHGIQFGKRSKAEEATDQLDAQFMRWLMYIMIPLCIGGSIYSLFYLPHRSWYSWCLETMVNGIYAFGLLLMTPQLFLNYRLKSVAHLPWKAMTYKAFNTFIDDFFAFIIVMPTSHRIACLRDDVIFLIYLYQRWLYPVDKSRVNEFGQISDETNQSKPSSDTASFVNNTKQKSKLA